MRDHFSPGKAASGELIGISDPIANVDWGEMSRKASERPHSSPPKTHSLLLLAARSNLSTRPNESS
jgi:hypothetical protein